MYKCNLECFHGYIEVYPSTGHYTQGRLDIIFQIFKKRTCFPAMRKTQRVRFSSERKYRHFSRFVFIAARCLSLSRIDFPSWFSLPRDIL